MKRGHTQNAYKVAVRTALYGDGAKMHNPAVKYSPDNGFFVESKLAPHESTTRIIWEASFDANTGKPYCLPRFDEIQHVLEGSRAHMMKNYQARLMSESKPRNSLI